MPEEQDASCPFLSDARPLRISGEYELHAGHDIRARKASADLGAFARQPREGMNVSGQCSDVLPDSQPGFLPKGID